MSRVPYLPKTNNYIDSFFEAGDVDRGGHHNYIAEREVCNLSPCFDNQTPKQQAESDTNILAQLKYFDR